MLPASHHRSRFLSVVTVGTNDILRVTIGGLSKTILSYEFRTPPRIRVSGGVRNPTVLSSLLGCRGPDRANIYILSVFICRHMDRDAD